VPEFTTLPVAPASETLDENELESPLQRVVEYALFVSVQVTGVDELPLHELE
jgi:hypothetical protein